MLLREDNLGLGAKVGGDRAETFGLSLFSGVLGRLNGKTEHVLEKEVKKEREVELRRGYAGMGFVSAGWLVGDRIERNPKVGEAGIKVEEGEVEGDRQTKKRKAEDDKADVDIEKPTKKSKKSKKDKTQDVERSATSDTETEAAKVKRKEKKRKSANTTADAASSTTEDRTLQKQEKRARKEERRKQKEERRARREAKALRKSKPEAAPVQPRTTATTTTTYPNVGNRQAVRQRYIQQKRMASMDPRAMQEIFMVKAAV